MLYFIFGEARQSLHPDHYTFLFKKTVVIGIRFYSLCTKPKISFTLKIFKLKHDSYSMFNTNTSAYHNVFRPMFICMFIPFPALYGLVLIFREINYYSCVWRKSNSKQAFVVQNVFIYSNKYIRFVGKYVFVECYSLVLGNRCVLLCWRLLIPHELELVSR